MSSLAMIAAVIRPKNPLSVTAQNITGNGQGFAACGAVDTTGESTATTPSGGTGPYTYSWVQGPGGTATAGPYTVTAATDQNPVWSDSNVCAADVDVDEEWTVTVTDSSVPAKQASTTIVVSLVWTDIT